MDFFIDTSGYDSRRWVWNKGYVYDQPINWNAGKSIGLNCASIKAGEALYEDSAFAMNWAGAKGRPREAWWFFRQNVNAVQQAKKFLSVIQRDWTSTDQATIDWETTDGNDRLNCLRNGGSFIYEVEKILNQPCAIYTYPAYWIQIGGEQAVSFKQHRLHLAQWPLDNWIFNVALPPYLFDKTTLADFMARIYKGNLKPMSLLPWGTNITAWQFTARANTYYIPGHPGIKKACDINAVINPWYEDVPPEPEPVPGPAYTEYVVIYQRINVRALPDSGSKWVRYAIKDEVLQINGKKENNYLQMTDGTWVFSDYVRLK